MVIRSYRRVFEVDRRIYRVDRWALPVPGGVPLRAVGYFVATLLLMLLLGQLPGVAEISAPIRFVVIPLAVAVLGTQAAPDGRVAHRFALDWLRLRWRSRRRSVGRALPLEGEPVLWHGELAVCWDADAPQLRPGRVRGPALVEFRVPVELGGHGRRVIARPAERGREDFVVLCAGTDLEVRP
jgi:hypothetical protein